MESAWMTPELSNVIINNEKIFTEIHIVISDIVTNRITILRLVENMRGVLTSTIAENREKGVSFLTAVLKHLPPEYLDESQVQFISKFYIQRLGDHHKMLPQVLEGYTVLVDMNKYNIEFCREFFTELFNEVSCQMQNRQERFKIYQIIQKLVDSHPDYIKTLGIDFPCGVIRAIDGERDPRNLIFLFNFLPRFIKNIPLGHMSQEMFSVLSCYFPIDFQPREGDPASVTRQDLADALTPCLYASPEFADLCIPLAVEKLDSTLTVAKIDSLKLLTGSCQTFPATAYLPFLKTIWSLIQEELRQRNEELKMAAHNALAAIMSKTATTANTNEAFDSFIRGLLISMQQHIVDAKTVGAYVDATKVLLTAANSCESSCIFITKAMIPATVTFYELKPTKKLQIAALEYLGDMYEIANNWKVVNSISNELNLIPKQCLAAVSDPHKDYQMAGFKTLIRVIDVLNNDLILPFVDILTHIIQHSTDKDLLALAVQTIHGIARKYPELIMDLVVLKKCNIKNLKKDQGDFQKRLKLLSSLASIDDFTKVVIEEMLKLMKDNESDAFVVVDALSESMSDPNLYTDAKITEIENDHGLVDFLVHWLCKEVKGQFADTLNPAFTLVSHTVSCLSAEKQAEIVANHARTLLELCNVDEDYFRILERLLIGLRKTVYDDIFREIMLGSLNLALRSESDTLRMKASALTAHFLNKAEFGYKFELLYEELKNYLSTCARDNIELCPRLIILYGWIAKALVLRGSDLFVFWLKKITGTLTNEEYCQISSQSICIIMTDFNEYLTPKMHCRMSILYKQRMYEVFSKNVRPIDDTLSPIVKESILLSWGHVCAKIPKSVLNADADMVVSLIINSMPSDNDELLSIMLELLCYFITLTNQRVAESMQTIIARLMPITSNPCMELRIKSLNCLYEIANTYRTSIILPYKAEVLFKLGSALDDHKRLVRNAAVKARTRWYLIGAPGEMKND